MKRIAVLALICILIPFCMGNGELNTEAVTEIDAIQMNSLCFTPEQFGEEKLEALLTHLYSSEGITSDVSLDESDMGYDVITLSYKGGEKESFFFFEVEDKWYMRTEDGTVIQEASFISEYLEYVEQQMDREEKAERNRRCNEILENYTAIEDTMKLMKEKYETAAFAWEYGE